MVSPWSLLPGLWLELRRTPLRAEHCASAEIYYADADDDGYGDAAASDLLCEPTAGFVANSNDCNDANALIYPGATEILNGFDEFFF